MNLIKTAVLGLTISVALVGSNLQGRPVEAADNRADIIVFMVDDLGFIADERVLDRLPNIRRVFLNGGIRLSRMYNENPLCCPARANFQTGQHTLRNGVDRNDGDLLRPRTTINFALKKAGYQTFMAGKYYNKYDGPRHPVGWDRTPMFRKQSDRLTSLSSDWVRTASQDKPLFAWFSSTAPHKQGNSRHPFVVERHRGADACKEIANYKPPTYRTWNTKRAFPRHMPNGWKSGWKLVPICESLLAVDEMVDEVVTAQKNRGRPAYFIFMSDNGMSWGQKGYPGKHVPTSARLPLYVAGPDIRAGSATKQLASIIDIAPTLAKIGGANLTWKVDGRSFLPLLKRREFAGRRRMLHYFEAADFKWTGSRSREWLYIRWSSGKKELYRPGVDYWERRNLSKKFPGKARQMNRRLNRQLKNASR